MLVSFDLLRFAPGRAQRELLTTWRHQPRGARFSRALFSADLTLLPIPFAHPLEFGLAALWDSAADRAAFDARAPLARRWADGAREHLTLLLDPVKSHGSWQGGDPIAASGKGGLDQPAVMQTSARVRVRGFRSFWRTNPSIVADVRARDGLLWQHGWADHVMGAGTLSLWRTGKDATRFAYGGGAHQAGIDGVRKSGWTQETYFCRHRLLEARGTWDGRPLPVAQ